MGGVRRHEFQASMAWSSVSFSVPQLLPGDGFICQGAGFQPSWQGVREGEEGEAFLLHSYNVDLPGGSYRALSPLEEKLSPQFPQRIPQEASPGACRWQNKIKLSTFNFLFLPWGLFYPSHPFCCHRQLPRG